jgi:NCK-associated protein 1
VDTIYKDTEPVFQSCLEVLSFLDEATRCFEDALLTRQMDFKFDKNTRLMAEFMDLFVGHIQIQLYLGSSSDIKLSLCVYGQAYLQKHGKADPNFVKLTTALQRMFDSPWRKIQEEMQNFSIPIANILSSLYMPYINGFTCETLRTNAVLNPVAEAMTLAMPSHKPIYQELLYLDRMHFWVIYGLLACPTQFSRSEIMELFKLVARSGYQIQIYRNEVFNYHDEIERLFSWFPNKTVPTKFDKDVKPKRIMGDVAKSAVISAGLAHRERRSFIVGELQNMLHTFRECPGLVAPKFPMVLAGLSMARAEIIWYFHHLQRKIPSRVKSKSHIKESYEAPQISLVVHLLQELSKFILKHGLVIQKYYLEYLKGADFSEMQRHIDAVVQSTTGLNPQIAQALQDILAIVNGADPDSPDGWTFESLRLTWDRLSAIFTSSTGANIRKMPGAEPLLKRMSTVVRHTAYIDKLPELLCEFVDLKDLWWYRHQLFGAKPGAQEFLKCIYGRNSQPLYAVSMASVLQSAGNNVSKFCPEITESLGEAMIKEAETQLEVVARSILSLLEPCCQQLQRYDQQIAPIEAAHRLHRQQEKRKAAGKGAVNHVPEPTAGFESRPQSRGAIRDLVEKERNLVELCSAVSNSEPIVVFNRCFHPCLFVKEKLQWALQDHMRKALKPSSGTAAIERPSVFLEKIVRFIRCCQRGLIHLDIDLHTMARQVLLQETFDTKVSTVGEVLLSAQRAESDPNSIVSKLADFYVALVEQHVSSTVLAGGSGIICYSSFRQAFVRYPVPGQKGVLPMHAELFTAPAELRALCTLIGPQGVRVIDSRLLSVIEKRVAQIKIILAADRQPLSELRNE